MYSPIHNFPEGISQSVSSACPKAKYAWFMTHCPGWGRKLWLSGFVETYCLRLNYHINTKLKKASIIKRATGDMKLNKDEKMGTIQTTSVTDQLDISDLTRWTWMHHSVPFGPIGFAVLVNCRFQELRDVPESSIKARTPCQTLTQTDSTNELAARLLTVLVGTFSHQCSRYTSEI